MMIVILRRRAWCLKPSPKGYGKDTSYFSKGKIRANYFLGCYNLLINRYLGMSKYKIHENLAYSYSYPEIIKSMDIIHEKILYSYPWRFHGSTDTLRREWVQPKSLLFRWLRLAVEAFGGTRGGKGLTNKNTIIGPLFYT